METVHIHQIQIETLEKIIENQQKQINILKDAVSGIRDALVSLNDRTEKDHDLLCTVARSLVKQMESRDVQ